jgi:dTDP-4-amino-4,6-dideoxygalactose transaminase
MAEWAIPFNRPSFVGKEELYIAEALRRGHVSGDGYFTEKCHSYLEELLGVAKALLTTSCTHALEMSALLLELSPGDEVILPSFTFVSTANAFVLRGATPRFADIRRDTLNLDESQLERMISSRTKAIVVVHYAGVGCEMDEILEIAKRNGLAVIEDNAHGLFGAYKGKPLGTFGCLAAQSFHETKNIMCGEGGALLINEGQYTDRAEVIREKGTNRKRFFRGQVDKYTWVDIGSSYLPSDMLAAVLWGQLEAHPQIQSQRKLIWERYAGGLRDWADRYEVGLPYVPDHCSQPYHMFYLIMPSLEDRQGLIDYLKRLGILSVFHYQSLHLSEMGRKFGGKEGDCPVTETISERLVRLPFFYGLAETDQARVIEGVSSFLPRAGVHDRRSKRPVVANGRS